MISKVTLPKSLPYQILRSKSNGQIGWAILLKNHHSILIEPTDELLGYCHKDEVLTITSKDDPPETSKLRFGSLKLYVGSFHDKIYLYISEGSFLFPLAVSRCYWTKLIKRLKINCIFTPEGEPQSSTEAFIYGLLT